MHAEENTVGVSKTLQEESTVSSLNKLINYIILISYLYNIFLISSFMLII